VSGAMNGRMLWWEDGYYQSYPVELGPAYKHASKPVIDVVGSIDFTDFAPVSMTTSGELFGAAVGNEEQVLAWVRDSHCILPEWPVRRIAGESVAIEVEGGATTWVAEFYDGVTGGLLGSTDVERSGDGVVVDLPDFEDSIALVLRAPTSS
jgi:hypothetical protein